MRPPSITMLRTLRWACLAGAFLSLEQEQVCDLDPERSGKLLQPGNRRRVHAALDQTDELHRAADLFRQPGLRQLPRLAQFGHPPAELFLKHGFQISSPAGECNAVKLRTFTRNESPGGGKRNQRFFMPR